MDVVGSSAAQIPNAIEAGRRRWISAEQADAIRQIDHFRYSEYQHLDLDALVEEYMQNFVFPLLALRGAPRSVADIGAGYGWLAFAFALGTDAEVTMMEYDAKRSQAAQQIAAILGVEHRIRWLVGSIAAIPLRDREIDAVYCVEVIEHTGVEASYVAELCRISNDVLVITTPNKVFPIIKHDTVLPFCHWLPLGARNVYAGLFGRRNLQQNNLFWSPRQLLGAVNGFERRSRFLQFADYATYLAAQGGRANGAGWFARLQGIYFAAAARTGRLSIFLLPNLASTFRRKIPAGIPDAPA
jgi:2-polyprenyl-3-methyl-5-hydroxy-6-metoxy-1,4-benzoquinol methylase